MIKKICPVCDFTVNEMNYCAKCRRWVRRPVMREVNYHLNERYPVFEKDCGFHKPDTAGSQQKSAPQGSKSFSASVAGMVALIILINAVPKVFDKAEQVLNGYGKYETAVPYEDSGYTAFDEEEVRTAGGQCTGYDHFPADGKQIADSMWQFINGSNYGYKVELGDSYCDNYGFSEDGSTISYYETITSIALEDGQTDRMDPSDENYIFQYVDINYDTATGELHDYISSLKNTEASLKYLEQFMKLTETAAGITLEESSVPGIMEQVKAEIVQEDILSIEEGIFNISIYQGDGEIRIYVNYKHPQTMEYQVMRNA